MLEEKKVVSWSLATLFLALMIVYTLMYMKKVEVFISPSPEEDMVETPVNATVHHSDTNDITTVNNGENTANSDVAVVNMHNEPTSWVTISNTQSSNTDGGTPDQAVFASAEPLRLLSGTTQFFGLLDIVDILGISPEYTLQDSKGNYFAHYGTEGLDFAGTVQQLGGNVYTMATENEILQNELFGDKVSFINLLVFKDKIVIMVIEIEGKTWLLQVPADRYHHEKSYLKSLFI